MRRLGCALLVLFLTHASFAEQLRFGTLQSDPANAKRNHAAGIRIATLEVAWDRVEPKPDQFDPAYLNERKARLATFRQHGMQVALDLGLQYPPAWVFELPNSRYVNQFGKPYVGDRPGANGANAVFSQAVRDRQSAYVARVLRDIGDVDIVRLGWCYYGELHFPTHRFDGQTNCYWAFDDLAQGKAKGLPPTLASCPVPGWKPGEKTADHHAASRFLEWYLACLQDYHDWQIRTVRKHHPGQLAMLYPSWGIRPGWIENAVMRDLDGSTPPEQNGEIQRGYAFARFIRGIDDAKVIVYCTWIDSDPAFGDDASDNPVRWSPVHYLSDLANRHPLKLTAMAENTGPGTAPALALSLERARKYKLAALIWAFEPNLYDGAPQHVSIDQFRQAVQAP